jgi:hypothetical protein
MGHKGAAPGRHRDAAGSSTVTGRILPLSAPLIVIAAFGIAGLSPRQLREAFRAALVEGIHRARVHQRIDVPQAEELIRVLPAKGRA